MPTPPAKAGRVKILLRHEQLDALMTGARIHTNAELAKRMATGVVESTVYRLRRDGYAPNASIIAGLLHAFPGSKFEQLFIVVDDEEASAAA